MDILVGFEMGYTELIIGPRPNNLVINLLVSSPAEKTVGIRKDGHEL